MKKMEQELDEYCGICFDCSKYDDCTKRSDDMAECPDFEEARFCLTPKGVFNSVLNDLGWCKFLDKKADISWELYEHRAPEHSLDKEAFTKVLVDIGFVGEGDNIIDVAFDAFVERMRRHGYLENNNKDEKEEENVI